MSISGVKNVIKDSPPEKKGATKSEDEGEENYGEDYEEDDFDDDEEENFKVRN